MGFLKAGFTFAVSTGTRMVAGLLIIKIIALYIGAEGLGQLGQFMSVINMMTVMAGGGITTGLVKYVSEYRNNSRELSWYLSSGSMITLASSGLIAVLLCLFAGSISLVLIGTNQYTDVIYVLAIAQLFIGLNNFAISVINGHQDTQGFAIVTVLGTVVGALLLYISIARGGLHGAMYGLVFMPTVVILFSIPYVFWRRLLSIKEIMPRYNKLGISNLLRYSVMACVTISTVPVAQIIIRKLIENRAGWESVGYWQGVSKISDAYLQFVTVVLANYYLPRLSAKTSKIEIKQEVYSALKIAFPATLGMALAVYFFREQIVITLFSSAFLPMRDYFFFQMIGDCLKVCAYTIVYVGIAKAMTKLCILAEIFQSVSLVLLAYYCLKKYGPIGITYAYAMNYGLYFVASFFMFRRYVAS